VSDEQIEPTTKIVKVYVTDRPRFLGVFHYGPAIDDTGVGRAGPLGTVSHVGPCKCGDPTHTFPNWYSVTPCVYIKGFGRILTIRIPWVVAYALSWATGRE
jgi:hypothetical protein